MVTNTLIDNELKLSNASAELDASGCTLNIPNLVYEQFSLPSFSLNVAGINVSYSVNQIKANSFQLSLGNGSIALTIGFENNSQALVSSSGFPPVAVTNLSVKVTFPIQFDSVDQYLQLSDATVDVTGTWETNFLGINFDLSQTINGLILSKVTSLLDETNVLEEIDYNLNVQLRDLLANLYPGNRITGVSSGPSSMTFSLEAP
jgi:hypothetical protein